MIYVVRIVCLLAGLMAFMFGADSKQKTCDKVTNYIFSVIFILVALLAERLVLLIS